MIRPSPIEPVRTSESPMPTRTTDRSPLPIVDHRLPTSSQAKYAPATSAGSGTRVPPSMGSRTTRPVEEKLPATQRPSADTSGLLSPPAPLMRLGTAASSGCRHRPFSPLSSTAT